MTDKKTLPEGFVGHLDALDSQTLRGWLFNNAAPFSPVPFQIRSENIVLYRGATGRRHPDFEQINPAYRLAGFVIDLNDLDLQKASGSNLEIWAEDSTGAPWFKAFEFTLPRNFLEHADWSRRRTVDERKFSASAVFAENLRYMLDVLVLRNTNSDELAAHYENRPTPMWPAASSDLYADLSARSEATNERLIDILKRSPPADITQFFDRAVTTSPHIGFDNRYYLEKHVDVAANSNPALHFLLFGHKENRTFRYLPLTPKGLEDSFFPSYFKSLLESEARPSPVAAEHVLQVIRKGLDGTAYYGNDEIEPEKTFFAFVEPFQPKTLEVEDTMFVASTAYITETFLSRSDADYAPVPSLAAHKFNSEMPRSKQPVEIASPQRGGVSILTC